MSEFAEAYQDFINQGYEVTVASPLGDTVPVDQNSIDGNVTQDFLDTAKIHLKNTLKLEDISADNFDVLFLPGGHGAMFDLPENTKLQELLGAFSKANKLISAVCHGAAGLVGAINAEGKPLVAGKRVNAFTDFEEKDTRLGNDLPFLLETKLRELGAIFVAAPNWTTHVEVDGNLITGQNPQSTLAVTKAIIEKLS